MVVLWDLRKNKPIIKVRDHYNRFGGELVTFGLPTTADQHVPQPCLHFAFISQVTTESEFLKKSEELQEALGSGKLLNYCQNKSQRASLPSDRMLWKFLKVAAPPRPQVDPQSSLIPLAPVPASLCQGSSMQTAGVNVALGPKAGWPLSVGLGLRPGPQDSWEDSPTPKGNFRSEKKTKKKLDEAAPCLEGLYEKLCEGTLSLHAVAGRRGFARCVDAGSPAQGLEVHACGSCRGVSGVSSFTPVLKAVLTTARQRQG